MSQKFFVTILDFLKRNIISLYHTFLVLSTGCYVYCTQQENKKLLFEQLTREDFLLKLLKEKDVLLLQKDEFISNKLVPAVIDSNPITNNDAYFYVGVICSIIFIGLTVYFLYNSDKPNSGPSANFSPKKKVSFDLPDENGSIEIIGPSNVSVSHMFQKDEENNKIVVELLKNIEGTVNNQSSLRADTLNMISASNRQVDEKLISNIDEVNKGLRKMIKNNMTALNDGTMECIHEIDLRRANELREELTHIRTAFTEFFEHAAKYL